MKPANENEIDQESANEIEVVTDPVDCKNVLRVCDPENMFEMIEQCKKCGRCV